MEKLLRDAKKQLAEIEAQGINMNNLEPISKLVGIIKNLTKIDKMEEEKDIREYGNYRVRDGYRDNYWDNYGGEYRDIYVDMYRDGRGYGRHDFPGTVEKDRNSDRMQHHMYRIMDGAKLYEAGRDRYRHGGDEHRMNEGLDKLMSALCSFIESTIEFADTPEEKEIVKKHIHKIKEL